jgi:hypothetical protein
MDEESREKIRKKEYSTYSKRKKVLETSPSDLKPLTLGVSPPPQPTLPKKNDIDLNIDMVSILAQVNVHVPLTKIMKIHSLRDKVKKFLSIQ